MFPLFSLKQSHSYPPTSQFFFWYKLYFNFYYELKSASAIEKESAKRHYTKEHAKCAKARNSINIGQQS